jgi:hypothetical protein
MSKLKIVKHGYVKGCPKRPGTQIELLNFLGIIKRAFAPRWVLLDSKVQLLMLGYSTVEGLGLIENIMEACPWISSISMEGMEQVNNFTRGELTLQLHHNDVED